MGKSSSINIKESKNKVTGSGIKIDSKINGRILVFVKTTAPTAATVDHS
jgi:hypothetical protein